MNFILKTSLVALCSCFLIHGAYGEGEKTPIPKDSTMILDFRGKAIPYMLGSPTAKKLSACENYEDLRDTLKIVISELIKGGT